MWSFLRRTARGLLSRSPVLVYTTTAGTCAAVSCTYVNPWDQHDFEEWKFAQRLLLTQNKEAGSRVLGIIRDRVHREQSVNIPAEIIKDTEHCVDTWGFLDRPPHTITGTQSRYMKAALMDLMRNPSSGQAQVNYAAATGCAVTLQFLVERKHEPYNGVQLFDDPALHFGVVTGNVDVVKFLVTLPKTDVNYYHEQGGHSCLDLLATVLREKTNMGRLKQDDVLWEVWRVLMNAGRGHFLTREDAMALLVRWGPMSLLRDAAEAEPTNFAQSSPTMLAELVKHFKAWPRADWQQRYDIIVAHLPAGHPLSRVKKDG